MDGPVGRNYLICQKNTLWKADEIVPKSTIVSREVTSYTGRTNLKTQETYENL